MCSANGMRRAGLIAILWVISVGPIAAQLGSSACASDVAQNVSGAKMRVWTDNHGIHQVHGRLIALGPQHARIRKQNGKNTTVPVRRLSLTDRDYVRYVRAVARRVRRTEASADPASKKPLGDDYSRIVYLRVAEDLIATLAERTNESSSPYSEVINGVPTRGTVASSSRTKVRLTEDTRRAAILLNIRGTNDFRTTSYSGRFRIYTSGTTQFARNIRFLLSENGLDAFGGRLATRSDSYITGVWTPFRRFLGRIVSGFVYREAIRQKPSFDRQALRMERQLVTSEMNGRVRAALKQVRQFSTRAVDAFGKVQEAFEIEPRFSTTADHLLIVLATPAKSLTNPPKAAPPAGPNAPVVVQIHSSVFVKAITEAEIIASLRPVFDKYLSEKSERAVKIRETIEKGKIGTSWTSDRQWFTVTWHPPKELPEFDLGNTGPSSR